MIFAPSRSDSATSLSNLVRSLGGTDDSCWLLPYNIDIDITHTVCVCVEMCLPYAVVQFLQEGNYSEIPSSWLTKDCTRCRWPPVKNVTFLLKNRSPPQVDWLVFDVTVECYCETLEKARKKTEDANYTTSCDEIKGRGKRVVYKKVIHAHDSCDDSVDDDSDVPPQINKTTQKKLKIDKGRDSSVIKPSCSNEDSNEKQSSCEYVSRLVAEESLSPPNRSLCDKLRTRKIGLLQEAKFNDINEPVASASKEVNVQNVDVITAVTEIATVGDVEKQIKISVEILKYVKSIDKRLKTLERGVNAEEPVHMFDNISRSTPCRTLNSLRKQ